MKLLLSDEEIYAIPLKERIGCPEKIAKAQLKKVVGWLGKYEDSCPECGWQLKPPFEDWKALLKEVENGR